MKYVKYVKYVIVSFCCDGVLDLFWQPFNVGAKADFLTNCFCCPTIESSVFHA